MDDPLAGMNPRDREWIWTLAEGFKRAGAPRAPIVPDPEVIKECVLMAAQELMRRDNEASKESS